MMYVPVVEGVVELVVVGFIGGCHVWEGELLTLRPDFGASGSCFSCSSIFFHSS